MSRNGMPAERVTRESDTQLAQRHLEGDPEAFGLLVDRYVDKVLAVLRRTVNHGRRAEDLVAEVFVRVFRHFDEFDPKTRFSSWLHAITTNVAESELRRRQRRAGQAPPWLQAVSNRVKRALRRGRQLPRAGERRAAPRRGTFERRGKASLRR